MPDIFSTQNSGLSAPGFEHYAVTPSNTTNEAVNFRSLYVGTGGDVVIVSEAGSAVTYRNAPSGCVIPMRGKRVNATGTTALNLVGMY